jgi:tRNA dimethylallyltransferase
VKRSAPVEDVLPHCLVLTGPTACGKSELALALAERFPVEIVSMDSAMVYRGMDIGTAKPSADLRKTIPHHLIDIREPSETYSVGEFCRDARRTIAAIRGRARVPLLVGGTFMYLRALRSGIASLPGADPALRAELDQDAAVQGWPALHARLAAVDAASAARIAPTDRQRIQRALEVHRLTGKPLSALQRENPAAPAQDFRVLALVPEDRAALARRIERRFDAMVEAGLVSEVERLMARGDLDPSAAAMRAVGYRQLWAYLAGDMAWPISRTRALASTRQLAKRQMTWLRSDPPDLRLAAFDQALLSRASAFVAAALDRCA